ncbi:hypothetical protein PQR15_38405 [Streptomyces lydicus]|nr:hypothetical protein [Streptomyces lydicus]
MWRLLDERYARGEHVTVAEMAATADRAPRTVRVHVTVLVRDGYLDIDRRTPLVRCGPPVPGPSHDGMTPRQWAAGLTIECSACRRIMTVVAELADRGWTTRGITQEELARHADMGRRTLGRHLRCHLVEGRWLEDGRTALLRREAAPLPMVADASAPGAQRYVGSSADRYILLSRLGPGRRRACRATAGTGTWPPGSWPASRGSPPRTGSSNRTSMRRSGGWPATCGTATPSAC